MKTRLLTMALLGFLCYIPAFGQDITRVNATSNEISDNLDLRAVASIFGEARDLEDFERRLNDPRNKISNLDLNFDRQVDYLRVIEAVERNTHLVILQAVLERDVFQDVATIEVERDRHNNVQIQVVGDVFMYGPNYIYEPIYVVRPAIFNVFWVRNYRPYCSPYYFNYYPSYYYAWTPYPLYRYRRNVHVHINQYNYYNYADHRRSTRAVAMHQTRRNNGFERNYQSQASTRNNSIDRSNHNNSIRRSENATTRDYSLADNTTRNSSVRNQDGTNTVRTFTPNNTDRSNVRTNTVRTENNATVRSNASTRNTQGSTRSENIRGNSSVRNDRAIKSAPVQNDRQTQKVRSSNTRENTNRSTRSNDR